jgi:hypothetical protein
MMELQLLRIWRDQYLVVFRLGSRSYAVCSSGFPIENVEVTAVDKQTASSFSAGLPQDAGFNEAIHRSGRAWKAHLHLAGCVAD